MSFIIAGDTHVMIDINKIVKFFNEHEGEYTSEDYLIICGDVVELRQYLQRVADNTAFTAWYFGHFHDDTEVDDLFYCLYDDIVVM